MMELENHYWVTMMVVFYLGKTHQLVLKEMDWHFAEEQDVYIYAYTSEYLFTKYVLITKKNNIFTVEKHGRYFLNQVIKVTLIKKHCVPFDPYWGQRRISSVVFLPKSVCSDSIHTETSDESKLTLCSLVCLKNVKVTKNKETVRN